MRMGALLGPITEAEQAGFLSDQARSYADAGFTSLWAAQAIGRGFMMTDPLLTLGAAAAVTDGVELGTAVLQVPLYQHADLAHRVFSLQQMCSGGLILGVGAGSTEQDFAAFERNYSTRFADFDTKIALLRDTFQNGGGLSPWPAVSGGPPLYFGTWGAGVVRAASEFDGWIASGHYRTVEQVCERLNAYRAAGGGRAIVSTLQVGADTDLGEFKDKLQQFAAAGFDDAVIMRLPGAAAAATLRKLLP